MTQDSYKSQIKELYFGEIYGESLFSKMAERQQDNSQTRQIWKMICQVEKLTGQLLRPVARNLGIDTEGLVDVQIERATKMFDEFSKLNELEIANYYRPKVPANLERLKQLECMAPIGDRIVLGKGVRHSELFLKCMDAIIEGSQSEVAKLLDEYLRDVKADLV